MWVDKKASALEYACGLNFWIGTSVWIKINGAKSFIYYFWLFGGCNTENEQRSEHNVQEACQNKLNVGKTEVMIVTNKNIAIDCRYIYKWYETRHWK